MVRTRGSPPWVSRSRAGASTAWSHPCLVLVLAAAPPRDLRRSQPHPSAGRTIGFRPEVVDLRTVAREEKVADRVIASSATPPFTPIGNHGGQRLQDGGMILNRFLLP